MGDRHKFTLRITPDLIQWEMGCGIRFFGVNLRGGPLFFVRQPTSEPSPVQRRVDKLLELCKRWGRAALTRVPVQPEAERKRVVRLSQEVGRHFM